MLPVLAVNLRTLGFTLLPGLPQRHGNNFLPDHDMDKLAWYQTGRERSLLAEPGNHPVP
jgi:hypothetical protein